MLIPDNRILGPVEEEMELGFTGFSVNTLIGGSVVLETIVWIIKKLKLNFQVFLECASPVFLTN